MTLGMISIVVGVILLVFLKFLAKDVEGSQPKGFHCIDHEEELKEDLDFDPTWAVLPSNIHHSDEED